MSLSPAELVAGVLNAEAGIAPNGAVVGPATDPQQQGGVISIMAAGLPAEDRYLPLQWMRAQLRCLAGTLDEAEAISQRVYTLMNGRVRITAHQASTDEDFLVHLVNVNAGPSMHYDSPETWETLLFLELLISTDPLELT